MACNVHIDLVPRTIAGAPAAELLANSMRLLPEALLLTEIRAGMQTAIFANEAFLQLSGYSMAEVLDRDLIFLQGPETDPSALVSFLRPPKADQISAHEVVLSKKDGTPFWDRVSARSGLELAQEIRRERSEMKVLFMSGHSHDARVRGPEVSNFFRKPFSAGALVTRIEELLRKTTNV